MTVPDGFLLGLAAVDLLAVAGMGWVGLRFKNTAQRGGARIAPAVKEVKAVADLGKAMAFHARDDGKVMIARVKGLVEKIKKRVETTKRLALELKPAAQETAASVQTTVAGMQHTLAGVQHTVHEKQAQVAETTAILSDIGRRLARLKTAAEAAVQASGRSRSGGG